MTDRTQIWSSGGGVQSTAIAVLILTGKLPKPDLSCIVDTERERSTTWEYFEQYTKPALASVNVFVERVPKSRYATVDLYGGKNKDSLLLPVWTTQSGETGKLPNYCSNEWKSRVLHRWAKQEHQVRQATMWMGMSTDEARRIKYPKGVWQKSYPLFDLGISRKDCVDIITNYGWPVPKSSSCWMCPNHKQGQWLEIKQDGKSGDFVKAIMFEKGIQKKNPHVFLTAAVVPLQEVTFSEEDEVLFGSCDSGMCFV